MSETPGSLANLRAELESLKAWKLESARRIRELEKYVDTVSSPLWKRLWWALGGWRFRRLGRWRR